MRCWGDGLAGRLGSGNTNDIGDGPGEMPPAAVNLGGTATAISAGAAHTCALLDDGTVRCWGDGAFGQLGYGNPNNLGDGPGEMPPAAVNLGGTATAITAGLNYTCALLDDGTVRCWGRGTSGQLGYGNTNDIGDGPGEMPPAAVNLGGTVTAITTGDAHTCAILDDGIARCWGLGNFGQLGYGNTNNLGDGPGEMPPPTINLGSGRTAQTVSAGSGHTCAVLDDDTVRCWGASFAGALGYANTILIGDNETPDTAGPVLMDNDMFRAAWVIAGPNGSVRASNRKATGESEPSNTVSSTPIDSMWFAWTAPATGVATFETCTAGFDTTLGAYEGDKLVELVEHATNDNGCLSPRGSLVKFGAIEGVTYRISVDGRDTAAGPFSLTWLLGTGFELNVSTAGNGVVSGEGIDCGTDCSEVHLSGNRVTLQATPDFGSTFAGWSGDCSGVGTCQVTMSQARSVTATFVSDALGCTILGTAGNDGLLGTSGSDVICAFGGNDIIRAGDGNDIIVPGLGNDVVEGQRGMDTVSYADQPEPVTVNLSTKSATGAGSDSFITMESVIGTPAADDITGNTTTNTLAGGGGADQLRGLGGNDVLIPGTGNDNPVDGGGGTDTVTYAEFLTKADIDLTANTASGPDAGSDTLAGLERAIGTPAGETIKGNSSDNVLTGGGGADTLQGEGASDTLLPGTGSDIQVDGGTGTDTVSYADRSTTITVDLSSGSATAGAETDPLTSIENATGGTGADTLIGSSSPNVLTGLDGADHLLGGNGNDDLLPGNGSDPEVDGGGGTGDTLSYADRSTAVVANLSTGIATGHGTDTLSNLENITGTKANDTLTGTTAANTLIGKDGNDILRGLDANDTLLPGPGDDPEVNGGVGTSDTVSYSDATAGVGVNLSTNTTSLAAGTDVLSGIENAIGTGADDTLTGSGVANILIGSDGADKLRGGGGNDVLRPGAGDDTEVFGDSDADTVDYSDQPGPVTVNLSTNTATGAGTDTLATMERAIGTDAADTLVGNTQTNVLSGLAGIDTINTQDSIAGDTADGGSGSDNCTTDAGDTRISCP